MVSQYVIKHLSTEVDFNHAPKRMSEISNEGPSAEIVIRLDVEYLYGVSDQWSRRMVNELLEEIEQVIKRKSQDQE